MDSTNTSEILQFYKDKSVFITGGTGFLGKTLIEKLLRSCYNLKKIYLLVRPKKGKTPSQRIEEITNCELYDQVKKLYPDFTKKLVPIQGDLSEPDLGISEEERKILIKNVNIVFHSAATVRFDEPLKVAVSMNIIGTKKVIELCKSLEKLDSFVHISTAYANCDRFHVSEEVYNPPVQPDKLIEAVDWLEDDLLQQLTPNFIQLRPNTYTYTKAIAETLVIQECKDKIPCAILRPSIVGATWREPFPGWIDNFNGPTAIFPAAGTGVLRSMLGNHDAVADIIPVDIPVNLMIAIAWYTALKNQRKIIVYNCTSGQLVQNKLTWGMLETFCRDIFFKNPFEKLLALPNPNFTTSKFVKLQVKIKKAVEVLEFFTSRQWEFTNDNFLMIMKDLNETDKKLFNFDLTDVNWKTYIENYCMGTKVYLMKEDANKLKECRNKLMK